MKKSILFLAFMISTALVVGQDNYREYSRLARKADSLYKVKDYKNAALTFSNGFAAIGWKGSQRDRYNSACSWALAGVADSAFYQLENIATKQSYSNYKHVNADPDLTSLHEDKRWKPLIELIKQNKDKAEANLNKPLAAQLDSIYNNDQKYRHQIDEIQKKFGWESKEMKTQWNIIKEKDSVNLIQVKNILNKYGWLGAEVVSERGNTALFLVIQHADKETQETYLPMMREAVKNGNARASNLALLEDRVALRQGKKQIYGSQIGNDTETNTYYVQPLDDPDKVDNRRAEVGLEPLAEYVEQWKIKWDVEQYKKDLPKIEAKEKKLN